MDYWFTADWHLGHKNIIMHCKRPFSSAEEMDEHIIETANSLIKPNDQVFFLGDLSMYYSYVEKYLPRLKGRWVMFRGNHDMRWWNKFVREAEPTSTWRLESWHDLKSFNVDKRKVVMCHYPLVTWDGAHHRSIMAHGHSHGNLVKGHLARIDVGIDCFDYKPINFDELRNELVSM